MEGCFYNYNKYPENAGADAPIKIIYFTYLAAVAT